MALYVVATPIGNLDDMTIRAVDTLRKVEAIIAEDTRTYRKLSTRFSIPNKPVYSLYKGNESARTEQLLPKLLEGLEAALVSESGTPTVSDPGALLVRRCLDSGVRVVPIPGPSTLTALLSASGIFCPHFTFLGFLPDKKPVEAVVKALDAGNTVVFFENPRRMAAVLDQLAAAAPTARLVVGRELTKKFEEIWSCRAADAPEMFRLKSLKGEMAVVVEPDRGAAADREPDLTNLRSSLSRFRNDSVPLATAVRRLADDFDLPRRRIYAEALKLYAERVQETDETAGPEAPSR